MSLFDAQSLVQALAEFTAPGVDRLSWLKEKLDSGGVPCTVLDMAGSRNLLVRYGRHAYSGRRQKCLAAHYDRHPGSPGANDNSAACLQLLELALSLNHGGAKHDCIIVFTDNEELAAGKGMLAQGAFALAEGFRRLGVDKPWVFCFDCTGRGDRIILSTASELAFSAPVSARSQLGPGPGAPALERLKPVREWTASWLGKLFPASFESLPTPHSDGLGFLMGGLPAVTLTLLPAIEAQAFRAALSEHPALADILLRKEYRSPAGNRLLDAALPDSWKRLHSKRDDIASLDAGAFTSMRSLLQSLAMARLPDVGK